MKPEFDWKYKNYESKAVPRPKEDKKNYTIVNYWSEKDKPYCFTITYWRCTNKGCKLRIIGRQI